MFKINAKKCTTLKKKYIFKKKMQLFISLSPETIFEKGKKNEKPEGSQVAQQKSNGTVSCGQEPRELN